MLDLCPSYRPFLVLTGTILLELGSPGRPRRVLTGSILLVLGSSCRPRLVTNRLNTVGAWSFMQAEVLPCY